MHELVFVKALQFTACLTGTAWGRYQTLWYNAMGLSPMQNGLLRTVGLSAKLMAGPIWGVMSDRTGKPGLMLVGSALSCAVCLECLRHSWAYSSMAILVMLKVLRSGGNGVGTLVDIITLQIIAVNKREGYGLQRLWTCLAWGVGSALSGYLIDVFGFGAMFLWTYGGTFLLCTLLMLRQAPSPTPTLSPLSHTEQAYPDRQPPACGSFTSSQNGPAIKIERVSYRRLVGPLWPVLLGGVLQGVAMALVEQILFLQLEIEFHVSKAFIGNLTLVGTLTELPCFAFSEQLIARYGHRRLLLCSQATLALRLVLMSQITPGLLVLIQCLHGPCFALFWSTIVDSVNKMAPEGTKGTAQSLLSTMYFVVGAGMGSTMWGAVYQSYGAATTYLLGLIALLLSAGLVAAGHRPQLHTNGEKLKPECPV